MRSGDLELVVPVGFDFELSSSPIISINMELGVRVFPDEAPTKPTRGTSSSITSSPWRVEVAMNSLTYESSAGTVTTIDDFVNATQTVSHSNTPFFGGFISVSRGSEPATENELLWMRDGAESADELLDIFIALDEALRDAVDFILEFAELLAQDAVEEQVKMARAGVMIGELTPYFPEDKVVSPEDVALMRAGALHRG